MNITAKNAISEMNLSSKMTTLPEFLTQQLASAQHAKLVELLTVIAQTVKTISAMTAKGALAGVLGKLESQNIQGETQMQLDVLTNQAFIQAFEATNLVAGLASEEMDDAYLIADASGQRPFLVVFDPLDGSSNIAVNVSVGSIFSVLVAPQTGLPERQDYLKAGNQQVAAGYALYGPSTMLVLTVGKGTHGFTLHPDTGDFVLTHPDIQIPIDTSEFAINASNERFWEPPVQQYISECRAGKTGVRERDFNMRWIASMVADVHRILMRGGVYLYPKDTKMPAMAGRLRLMYEANPMGMIVEQAGGISSTGRKRILEVEPEQLHQRIPVIMGSCNEVLRIERYYQAFDANSGEQCGSPLFNDRSLYRQAQ